MEESMYTTSHRKQSWLRAIAQNKERHTRHGGINVHHITHSRKMLPYTWRRDWGQTCWSTLEKAKDNICVLDEEVESLRLCHESHLQVEMLHGQPEVDMPNGWESPMDWATVKRTIVQDTNWVNTQGKVGQQGVPPSMSDHLRNVRGLSSCHMHQMNKDQVSTLELCNRDRDTLVALWMRHFTSYQWRYMV
jgi:hypothetical protein